MDMLERRNPDISNLNYGSTLINEKNELNSQATEITKNLNNSYLTIQGPPGTGKTYTYCLYYY